MTKMRTNSVRLAAFLIGTFCWCQTALSTYQAQPFTGVWRGQIDTLPAVTIVISDESGSLNGAILFYLLKRPADGAAAMATAGIPEPLFHLRRDGKTLYF
jgi:hypothetical protein